MNERTNEQQTWPSPVGGIGGALARRRTVSLLVRVRVCVCVCVGRACVYGWKQQQAEREREQVVACTALQHRLQFTSVASYSSCVIVGYTWSGRELSGVVRVALVGGGAAAAAAFQSARTRFVIRS